MSTGIDVPRFEPKDFILLVLLSSWLVLGPYNGGCTSWEIIDFFSGKGRISRLAAKAGFRVASYEILHDLPTSKRRRKNRNFPRRSFMDFNGESGFAYFGRMVFNLKMLLAF